MAWFNYKWDAYNCYVAFGRLWIGLGPWKRFAIVTSPGITKFDILIWKLRITIWNWYE